MKLSCALLGGFAIGVAACSQTSEWHDLVTFGSEYARVKPADFEEAESITFTAQEGEPINHLFLDSEWGLLLYLPPWPRYDRWKFLINLHESLGENCIGLRDVSMKYSGWYLPIFYASESCRVTGTPIFATRQVRPAQKRRAK